MPEKPASSAERVLDQSSLPPALAVWTNMLLGQAHHRAQALVAAALEPLNIRLKQYGLLLVLSEEGPLAQAELGRRLQIDRTTMVFFVDELEQSGLVSRCRAANDRRIHAVTLTAEGRALLTAANERVRQAEEAFLEPLSDVERGQLRALLLRLT